MADFKLDPNYNDVASRLHDLREKHPDACVQPLNLERPFWFETLNDEIFLVYIAACYRTPDDPRPGVGSAWEPFPGRTPYTKNSELMVAETSAWGRAIVAALAADTKKGVASSDEIAARQREPAASAEARDKAVTAIAELDAGYQAAVADWLRNNKVPSLKRSGATLTQLNELEDFIAQLGTEPFGPVEGEGVPSQPATDVSSGPSAADVSGRAAPSHPEPESIPFAPVVASGTANTADDAGTTRKAVNSAMKAER